MVAQLVVDEVVVDQIHSGAIVLGGRVGVGEGSESSKVAAVEIMLGFIVEGVVGLDPSLAFCVDPVRVGIRTSLEWPTSHQVGESKRLGCLGGHDEEGRRDEECGKEGLFCSYLYGFPRGH